MCCGMQWCTVIYCTLSRGTLEATEYPSNKYSLPSTAARAVGLLNYTERKNWTSRNILIATFYYSPWSSLVAQFQCGSGDIPNLQYTGNRCHHEIEHKGLQANYVKRLQIFQKHAVSDNWWNSVPYRERERERERCMLWLFHAFLLSWYLWGKVVWESFMNQWLHQETGLHIFYCPSLGWGSCRLHVRDCLHFFISKSRVRVLWPSLSFSSALHRQLRLSLSPSLHRLLPLSLSPSLHRQLSFNHFNRLFWCLQFLIIIMVIHRMQREKGLEVFNLAQEAAGSWNPSGW